MELLCILLHINGKMCVQSNSQWWKIQNVKWSSGQAEESNGGQGFLQYVNMEREGQGNLVTCCEIE